MHKEVIRWKKCSKCGFLQHSSHLRCLNCKYDKFSIIKAFGNCVLLSFTVLKAPPAEFRDQTSYALGVVEFENGIKALGQILTPENLKIGIKLKPFYKDINGLSTLAFEPID